MIRSLALIVAALATTALAAAVVIVARFLYLTRDVPDAPSCGACGCHITDADLEQLIDEYPQGGDW